MWFLVAYETFDVRGFNYCFFLLHFGNRGSECSGSEMHHNDSWQMSTKVISRLHQWGAAAGLYSLLLWGAASSQICSLFEESWNHRPWWLKSPEILQLSSALINQTVPGIVLGIETWLSTEKQCNPPKKFARNNCLSPSPKSVYGLETSMPYIMLWQVNSL